MPWPARCTRECCKQRQRLARAVQNYIREPRCKRCGGRLRIDVWRLAHERKRRPCNCYGYSFPHRPGSKWCDHNPALTPEMLQDRERYA